MTPAPGSGRAVRAPPRVRGGSPAGRRPTGCWPSPTSPRYPVPAQPVQRRCDLLEREDLVDHPSGDGGRRHLGTLGLGGVLGDEIPAVAVDDASPVGAVVVGPREDDADHAVAV